MAKVAETDGENEYEDSGKEDVDELDDFDG